MANQQLIEYIKGELSKGTNKDDVRNALIKVGWPITDIEEAMIASMGFDSMPTPPVSSLEPSINSAYSRFENPNISPENHTFPPVERSGDDWFKSAKPAPKRERAVIIIAVLALLLIAGGVLGYTYYSQIPGIVLKKMASKMESIKTVAFSSEVNTNIEMTPQGVEPVGPTNGSAKVTMDGVIDATDEKNPDLSMKINTTGGVEGMAVSFGMEMRMIEKIIYFKISEFPLMETLGMGNLKDQWIKVDIAAIAQKYNLEELEKQFNAPGLLEKITPEQKKQIDKMWNDELVKSAKNIVKMKEEKINEVNSYHYQIPLDKNAIADLTTKTLEILGTDAIGEEEKATYTEMMRMMDYNKLDLWVGKKDNLPTKMTFDITINLPENAGKYGLNYIWYFKDYNKKVTVEAPSDSKPVEEIIEALMGGIIGGSPESQKDTRAMSAMSQIAAKAEMLFVADNSYVNLSCLNAGIKPLCDEIDEIMGGYPLIRKPAGSRPAKYCAVIILKELSGSSKQYYCIDDSGANMKTTINPTTFYCTKTKFTCPPSFIN